MRSILVFTIFLGTLLFATQELYGLAVVIDPRNGKRELKIARQPPIHHDLKTYLKLYQKVSELRRFYGFQDYLVSKFIFNLKRWYNLHTLCSKISNFSVSENEKAHLW